MSAWRRKAIKAVPELKHTLENVENPMQAWIEINLYFEKLNRETDNKAIDRILSYARWCLSEQAGKLPSNTSTAVCYGFYEHLPIERNNWIYFNKWFTKSEFESLKGIFLYHIGEEKLNELSMVFYSSKKKA